MDAKIGDFITAIDRWAEQVGGEPNNIYTLLLIAIGRFGTTKSEDTDGSLDDFVSQLRSGELSARYRLQFEENLQSVIRDTSIQETFLIVGAVRYVERFLDHALEDAVKLRRESAAQFQEYRKMLADTVEAQRAADRQNRLRLPNMPDVTVEDLRDSVDDMEVRYAPPITLEYLKDLREQIDAWREIVVPILNA